MSKLAVADARLDQGERPYGATAKSNPFVGRPPYAAGLPANARVAALPIVGRGIWRADLTEDAAFCLVRLTIPHGRAFALVAFDLDSVPVSTIYHAVQTSSLVANRAHDAMERADIDRLLVRGIDPERCAKSQWSAAGMHDAERECLRASRQLIGNGDLALTFGRAREIVIVAVVNTEVRGLILDTYQRNRAGNRDFTARRRHVECQQQARMRR